MKSKIGLLMKIQVMRVCNPAFFKNNSDAQKKKKILITCIGAVLLSVLMMGYSGMLAYGYVRIGESGVVPRMMLGTCALLLVFLTFLKSSGALFGSRDFDMIMSLPVKRYQVVAAKFSALYLVGLFAHMVFFLPALVVYSVYTGPGAGEIAAMVLIILTAPILPTVLALALGTLIVALTSKLPHRQFFSILFSVIALMVLLVWMGGFSLKAEDADALAGIGIQVSGMIGRIYPPAAWAVSPLEGRGMGGLFVFIAVSAAAFGIFAAAVSKFYIRINSALASLKRRQARRVRSGKVASPFRALYRKELHRLTTCTIYAMNTTVGYLMMLAAGIAVLVMKPAGIEKVLGISGLETVIKMLPMVLAVMVSISPTTAPSLSLEGKSRWIMCSLPVSPIKIFQAKIALNLSLALPAILISGICFGVKFRPAGLNLLLLFIIPAAYSLFSAVFGMFVNVKFPSYDWTHEQQAVKSSMAVMISIFGGMILPIIPLVVSVVFPAYAPLFSAAGGAVALGIAGLCYKKLKNTVLYV